MSLKRLPVRVAMVNADIRESLVDKNRIGVSCRRFAENGVQLPATRRLVASVTARARDCTNPNFTCSHAYCGGLDLMPFVAETAEIVPNADI